MRTIFRGKIARGKLEMSEDFYAQIQRLEGSEIDLTLEKHRNKRSVNQSNYYFGVIVKMLSDELGYSKGEMHEILRGKFLSEEIRVGNEVIRYAKSTADLKTDAFENLMTDIREWSSSELNIFLPTPNEIILDN
jgi:hypothetical protein